MTTTQILGLNVTASEHERFEQIRSEMIASGHTPTSAEVWAGNAIGIGNHVRKAQAERAVYAEAVAAGSARNPVTLLIADA